MAQVTDIWNVVEPYLAEEKVELDDLELSGQGKGRVLRVIVDADQLDIERIAELSRNLSRLLDAETDLDGAYQLEVSSPGLERKLKRPEHFRKSLGREVVVKAEVGGEARTLRGVITAATEANFTVSSDDEETLVGYEDVSTAKTVFKWEKAPKPGR